jgi:hypothetical protein
MNCANVCLTLPKEMLSKIDESRGDVSRSRYILRLVQKAYNDNLDQGEEEN